MYAMGIVRHAMSYRPRLPRCRWIAVALASFWTLPSAFSATNLPATDLPVTVDGVLDEEAWQAAVRIEIDTETRPGENIPARVETVAYLVSNGKALYIAFDARDPDPTKIRAYLQDRDSAWNDDFVGVVLDTYNDQRRAFEFFSNPLGIQMDLTNDDVNENEDDSWDAIWDSAGRIGADGYVVEMEIPLNQLRFPKTAGQQVWGIDLLRFYPRDQRYRLSNNALDRSVNCYLCQFAKIEGLAGVEPGRDLELVPTLTASRTDSTEEPGAVPLGQGPTDTAAGVSIRWGIAPDTTANLAINPDFSQVEADVAQLEVNNQFALFYPEKRPFFLEGADYFSTPIDAVFTRTVADPDVGAKLTGKRGNHTYGVFAARDSLTNLLFPAALSSDSTSLAQRSTAFVGRYSLGFGQASSVGGLLAARNGDDYHNTVGGFDVRWKINDQHSVQAQYLRSDTGYPEHVAGDFGQPAGDFSGDALAIDYEYDSRDWYGYLKHRAMSAGFRADAGFEPQVDFSKQSIGLTHIWHGDEDDPWTQIRLNGNWDIVHDDADNLLEREVEVYLGIGGPMQSWWELEVTGRDAFWDGVLYRENKVSTYFEFQPKAGLALGAWIRYGDQIDFDNSRLGDEWRIEPWFDWFINRHLSLKLRATLVELETKADEPIFDADVYDLRLTWQFSRRSFLRLTAQLSDIERNPAVYVDPVDAESKQLGRQLLFSYKINPQTVFFLGYSDNLVDDDELHGFEETDRTVFLKFGYAWTP
jgi:hypothetical protein